jgi:hypothetical protein
MKSLIERNNSTITKNTIQTDLTYETTVQNIGKRGFNFGIALVHSNGTNIVEDSTLMTMEITQHSLTSDQIGDNHNVSSSVIKYAT